ncbi:MAG: hypothetical protein ACKOI2_05960 [Actinomycetota bacterium]
MVRHPEAAGRVHARASNVMEIVGTGIHRQNPIRHLVGEVLDGTAPRLPRVIDAPAAVNVAATMSVERAKFAPKQTSVVRQCEREAPAVRAIRRSWSKGLEWTNPLLRSGSMKVQSELGRRRL